MSTNDPTPDVSSHPNVVTITMVFSPLHWLLITKGRAERHSNTPQLPQRHNRSQRKAKPGLTCSR